MNQVVDHSLHESEHQELRQQKYQYHMRELKLTDRDWCEIFIEYLSDVSVDVWNVGNVTLVEKLVVEIISKKQRQVDVSNIVDTLLKRPDREKALQDGVGQKLLEILFIFIHLVHEENTEIEKKKIQAMIWQIVELDQQVDINTLSSFILALPESNSTDIIFKQNFLRYLCQQSPKAAQTIFLLHLTDKVVSVLAVSACIRYLSQDQIDESVLSSLRSIKAQNIRILADEIPQLLDNPVFMLALYWNSFNNRTSLPLMEIRVNHSSRVKKAIQGGLKYFDGNINHFIQLYRFAFRYKSVDMLLPRHLIGAFQFTGKEVAVPRTPKFSLPLTNKLDSGVKALARTVTTLIRREIHPAEFPTAATSDRFIQRYYCHIYIKLLATGDIEAANEWKKRAGIAESYRYIHETQMVIKVTWRIRQSLPHGLSECHQDTSLLELVLRVLPRDKMSQFIRQHDVTEALAEQMRAGNDSAIEFLASEYPDDVMSLLEALHMPLAPDKVSALIKQRLGLSHRHTPRDFDDLLDKIGAIPASRRLIIWLTQQAMAGRVACMDFVKMIQVLFLLDIYDRGRSEAGWVKWLQQVIRESESSTSQLVTATIPDIQMPPILHGGQILEDSLDGYNYLRCQGRTVLFLHPESEEIIALKIEKPAEGSGPFLQEAKSAIELSMLQQQGLLKSRLPIPVGVLKIGRARLLDVVASSEPVAVGFCDEDRAALMEMIAEDDSIHVYVYKVNSDNKGYFKYLHDVTISWPRFEEACFTLMDDLAVLLQHGRVYNQLADIFHNTEAGHHRRNDGGRYLVLADLLQGLRGSGRITAWKKAVEYVNAREFGLADLGDYISIGELSSPLAHDWQKNKKLANAIAEYFLVLQLVVGARASKLCEGKAETYRKEVFDRSASLIVRAVSAFISNITGEPYRAVYWWLSRTVNLQRYAHQMRFWMTNEYIPYVNESRLPDELYEDAEITIDRTRFRRGTYNDKTGQAINGVDQDLGPVNGQEPIKEGNKLFYFSITTLFTILDAKAKEEALFRALRECTTPKDYELVVGAHLRVIGAYQSDGFEARLLQVKRRIILSAEDDLCTKLISAESFADFNQLLIEHETHAKSHSEDYKQRVREIALCLAEKTERLLYRRLDECTTPYEFNNLVRDYNRHANGHHTEQFEACLVMLKKRHEWRNRQTLYAQLKECKSFAVIEAKLAIHRRKYHDCLDDDFEQEIQVTLTQLSYLVELEQLDQLGACTNFVDFYRLLKKYERILGKSCSNDFKDQVFAMAAEITVKRHNVHINQENEALTPDKKWFLALEMKLHLALRHHQDDNYDKFLDLLKENALFYELYDCTSVAQFNALLIAHNRKKNRTYSEHYESTIRELLFPLLKRAYEAEARQKTNGNSNDRYRMLDFLKQKFQERVARFRAAETMTDFLHTLNRETLFERLQQCDGVKGFRELLQPQTTSVYLNEERFVKIVEDIVAKKVDDIKVQLMAASTLQECVAILDQLINEAGIYISESTTYALSLLIRDFCKEKYERLYQFLQTSECYTLQELCWVLQDKLTFDRGCARVDFSEYHRLMEERRAQADIDIDYEVSSLDLMEYGHMSHYGSEYIDSALERGEDEILHMRQYRSLRSC